jgi:hypothetical protein
MSPCFITIERRRSDAADAGMHRQMSRSLGFHAPDRQSDGHKNATIRLGMLTLLRRSRTLVSHF